MNSHIKKGFSDGFLTKCAEYGIDPRLLTKKADRDNWMTTPVNPAQQLQNQQARSLWWGSQWNKARTAAGNAWGKARTAVGNASRGVGNALRRAGNYLANDTQFAHWGKSLGTSLGNWAGSQKPLQAGSAAIQQNGRVVNPRDIAQRYNRARGITTQPGQVQPSQNGIQPIQANNAMNYRKQQLGNQQTNQNFQAWRKNNDALMQRAGLSGQGTGNKQLAFLQQNPNFFSMSDDDRTNAVNQYMTSMGIQ